MAAHAEWKGVDLMNRVDIAIKAIRDEREKFLLEVCHRDGGKLAEARLREILSALLIGEEIPDGTINVETET